VKQKENPGLGAGAEGNAPHERDSHTTGSTARVSVGNCPRPLRSFKAEHAEFCRLVMSPRWRHRNLTLAELEAQRMAAAYRTISAALRKMPPDDVIALARRMATNWTRYASLPNCPPPFEFDEMDAVRMALDVERRPS
jgi:hypothetical protein